MENNKTERPIKNSAIMADLFILFLGAAFLAGALFFMTSIELAQIAYGSGLALMLMGTAVLTLDIGIWRIPAFVSKSIGKVRDLSHKIEEAADPHWSWKPSKRRSFRRDQSAIVPAILVALIGIAVTIIAWIPLGYVAYAVIDSFMLSFEFPSVALGTIHLMQWVIAWTPAVIIVGLLLYVIVNAFRTEYPSGPVGM